MTPTSGNPNDDGRLARLREAATEIVRRLREHGHEAYFAGGCVRDRLLGMTPTDYDIATSARPDEISNVFTRVQHVGESFGVALVMTDGFAIEVATFRTDGVYADGRHPESVTFSSAEHDAQRRDFTINGLFEDPIEEKIIDLVDGQADLRDRMIRAIGDPDARLAEDRLRLLRAVRFAARFGFSLDSETAHAIRQAAGELTGVSRERIGQELRRMFEHENRGVAAWELQYLGLDQPVLDEPHQAIAPMHLGRLPEAAQYATSLAAWLVDRHPASAEQWKEIAVRWGKALVLSNVQMRELKGTLNAYRVLRSEWATLGVAGQKRLAGSGLFHEALLLLQCADRAEFVAVRRRVDELRQTASGVAPEPLVTGEDLIQEGLSPGPQFRRLLEATYDGQLEGTITTRDQAVQLARFLEAQQGD